MVYANITAFFYGLKWRQMTRTITAMTAQKRHKDRVNLFLDGEFAFGLTLFAAASLRIGQQLSDADIEQLRLENDYEEAKNRAFNFITYRPRSERELRQNLAKKEYSEATVERVIATLKRLEMLDDRAFARYWVEQRDNFKPRSNMALRQELAQKGIASNIVDEVLAPRDDNQAAAEAAAKRTGRWSHLPREEFALKMMRYLQGRGFGYGICREVVDEIWETLQTEESN